MEIILREDYKELGNAGETVKVKDGFARNYLIPAGVAYPDTRANRRLYENEIQQQTWRQSRDKKAAEEMAKKLETISCTITVQVGEEDKLFGSVT